MSSNRFNIVVCASGGGGNFQALIDARENLGIDIPLLVVDRTCGAINRAVAHGIAYVVLNDAMGKAAMFDAFVQAIPADVDLIVLAGFMPILPARICERWQGKIINTHPSLLPKYGGKGMYGVKVQEAVMRAKEEMAGCTVHFVNAGIDEGSIILQKAIAVDYKETPWQLGGRIFKEENRLLVEAVKLLRSSATITKEQEMGFSWKKMGQLFDPTQIVDRPEWMVSFAQAPNVIIFEDFVRVYFCCRPAPDANMQYVSYCAFVDLARNDLTKVRGLSQKPILELGGLGAFDEFGTYPVSVMRDGDDIIAIYGGWSRCESVPFNISLGLARSKDGGVTFEKFGTGPILSHSPDEPFVVTSPKVRKYGNTWHLAYTAGRRWILGDDKRPEIIYKLRMATSKDGINWTKQNTDIIDSRLGEDEAQACPDIFFANGKYHMFFCYREGLDFRDDRSRSYRIGYARSTDLVNWTRDDSLIDLDISPIGWDSEMVAYPTLFELDGSVYMIYGGNGNGRTGFGLAKLEGELR